MGLLYASEAWILSILGWVWLMTQEIWGFSLLSAFVYYGMLLLSTCNVILVGCFPGMRSLRSAYLSAVLILAISSASCIFDTVVESNVFGSDPFKLSLSNGTKCSLAKMNRVLYFSDAPLYLAQGGVILGYLLIHLFVAAGAMAVGSGEDGPSIWPGSAWGLALMAMVAFRYYIILDGSAKGMNHFTGNAGDVDRRFRYLYLFSEPVWELSMVFLVMFEVSLVLLTLEGCPLPALGQRKFLRYFNMGFTPAFVVGASVVLYVRGMLTLPSLLALGLAMPPAVAGTVEAAMARPPALVMPAARPSAPPEAVTGRSVYNRPDARSRRHYIPVPVEMISEKSKAV